MCVLRKCKILLNSGMGLMFNIDIYNPLFYNANYNSIMKRGIILHIGAEQIENKIREDFGRYYKAFGSFVDSGFLWDESIAAVRDGLLLSHVIFCNDVHQIPPVHTFLRANKNIKADLSEIDKRSIGAFWGFVFKYVFGYRNQKSATAKVNTIKTATYFFDAPEVVNVDFEKRLEG